MRLFVYDMLVNVIYYVHVCEQARWARSAGNSAIENVCIIIINYDTQTQQTWVTYGNSPGMQVNPRYTHSTRVTS